MTNTGKIIDAFASWIENEENGVCFIPLNLCEKVLKLLKEQDRLIEEARNEGYNEAYHEYCVEVAEEDQEDVRWNV